MEGTQDIDVPLTPGDMVTIVDEEQTVFEDTVEQHVPKLGLVRFEDSDVGRFELSTMMDECEAMHIVKGR